MAYVLTDQYPQLKDTLDRALDEATRIVKKWMPKYESGDVYPVRHDKGQYVPITNGDPYGFCWEEGFWPGLLWLSYEATQDPAYRELAEKNVLDFYDRVYKNYNIDWHHDTGFLYIPSCVAAWKLTGNEYARCGAEMAAMSLSRRFRYKGNFIQSMSYELDADNYKLIVDTMMNLPLLFWMAEQTGDSTYREKAVAHMNSTMTHSLRPDGTTFHHFLMDVNTGEPIRGITWQGAADDSCWSRGQAWVVYGLALAYAHTKDEAIIGHFERVTDYFLDHLPKDHIPYWDFAFSDGSHEPRDSSAAAIAVCGILEMARHLQSPKMTQYIHRAAQLLQAMVDTCAAHPDEQEEGVLRHATEGKPQGLSVDASIIYGDYFYVESLLRATRDWDPYW